MSYCDDCILLDICGKEGSCDEAMTFCADKNKFTYISTLDKIRAEIKALSNVNPSYWHSGDMVEREEVFGIIDKYKAESDHKCHTCKHYTSGEQDGSCDSYVCEHYSGWEVRDKE